MLADKISEVIFIGLPGPTHHYGGLSADNVASSANEGSTSNPREAALQALALARRLKELGLNVGLLAPQLRPHIPLLAEKFAGDADTVIRSVAKADPKLLEAACSSSAMWAANAATVTPYIDSGDAQLHLTVANLYTNVHRRIEAEDTFALLGAIFSRVPNTSVHEPLVELLRDEGAANHTRLCETHSDIGLHVFVYGTDGGEDDPASARQTLAASEVIAAQHNIAPSASIFIRQNPAVIEAGVFHNDVIAVGNGNVLLVHQSAFAGGQADVERIALAYRELTGGTLIPIIISTADLSVEEAVKTYFFNSQLVTKPDGKMAIIAPIEISEAFGGKAEKLFQRIIADSHNPIDELITLDLRQSMRNGGGPACLRLRVPMTGAQISALKNAVNVLVDDTLLDEVERIVRMHYREELTTKDLADPALYHACKTMRSELLALMQLEV